MPSELVISVSVTVAFTINSGISPLTLGNGSALASSLIQAVGAERCKHLVRGIRESEEVGRLVMLGPLGKDRGFWLPAQNNSPSCRDHTTFRIR